MADEQTRRRRRMLARFGRQPLRVRMHPPVRGTKRGERRSRPAAFGLARQIAVGDEFAQDRERAQEHLEGAGHPRRAARQIVVVGQVDQPGPPGDRPVADLHPVGEEQVVERLERLLDGGERRVRLAQPERRHLLVAVAHQPEGVLVEAAPDMQPMLEDAVALALLAAARALAAEPPAHLVDGHLMRLAQLWIAHDRIGGGDCSHPAADDRDLLPGHPARSPCAPGRGLSAESCRPQPARDPRQYRKWLAAKRNLATARVGRRPCGGRAASGRDLRSGLRDPAPGRHRWADAACNLHARTSSGMSKPVEIRLTQKHFIDLFQ